MINAVAQVVTIISVTVSGLYSVYKLLDRRFNSLEDDIDGLNDVLHTVRSRNEVMANILLSLCKVNDRIDDEKAKELLSQNGLDVEDLVSPDEFIKGEGGE